MLSGVVIHICREKFLDFDFALLTIPENNIVRFLNQRADYGGDFFTSGVDEAEKYLGVKISDSDVGGTTTFFIGLVNLRWEEEGEL